MTAQIIEIDKQMTSLRRVSNGEISQDHILKESIELSERLGNTINQINAGLENFAKQGFRGDGLIAMTEAATMFSNISDMTVDEASSGITSIINGFQMLPEEAQKAVDAINEVDNNYAISSQNIVQSMQKSVGAAQTFGKLNAA
jgi:TP901 family phage tail tape measure protein